MKALVFSHTLSIVSPKTKKMSRSFQQGTGSTAVLKDAHGVMEDVLLDPGTSAAAGSFARFNTFSGTVAGVKADFTTNANWGPNCRWVIIGAGGEPGLQLPDKDDLDAALAAQNFRLTEPVSFEMIVVFEIIGNPIPLLDSADGLVTWEYKSSGPLVAHNHEQWRLRLLKGPGAWTSDKAWIVEAVRTRRLPHGFSYLPKITGTAAGLSGNADYLLPDYYIQISDASANFVLPTFAQFEARLGDMGSTDAEKAELGWKVNFHNDDGANALTFAGATGVTADTDSIVAIATNGTGQLYIKFNSSGNGLRFFVI
jgi:hypothetical protein